MAISRCRRVRRSGAARGESRCMAGGGRIERESRRRARAVSVVVPFPRREAGGRLDLARLVPSGRSLLVSFALVVAVFGAYWSARATSVFAVQRIDVQGAPEVAREVEAATEDTVGVSLLAIDAGGIEDTVRALPSVAGVSVDLAFPHTLVVKVAAERAVAVARRGHTSWLVTASGRVIREIETGTQRGFPRLWLTRDVPVRVGGTLPSSSAAGQGRALGGRRADTRPPSRPRDTAGRGLRSSLETLGRRADLLTPRRRHGVRRRKRSRAPRVEYLPQLLGRG